MSKNPPSDIIELIIGIDLNPDDPKPINVDLVGEDEGSDCVDMDDADWKSLCMELLSVCGLSDGPKSKEEVLDIIRDLDKGEDPFGKHLEGRAGESVEAGPEHKSDGLRSAATKLKSMIKPDDYEKKEEEEEDRG